MALPPKKTLECRIIVSNETDPSGPPYPSAEVELRNVSETDVEIERQSHVFQYLDVIVKNLHGQIVSRYPYGLTLIRYGSPTRTLLLKPGESFKAAIRLMGTTHHEDVRKGRYQAYAIFDNGILRSTSEVVEFDVEGY